jgi:hypothetical protein
MTYDIVGSLCQIVCADMFTGWPGNVIGVDLIIYPTMLIAPIDLPRSCW